MTPIVTAPADVLTTPTLFAEPCGRDTLAVAGELMETLAATPHAAGIAANQIGSSLSIFVYRDDRDGPVVLANPKIVERSGSQTGWEGCLSLPDDLFLVKRPRSVIVEAHDIVGDSVRRKFHDFPARMMAHEIDLLNGRLVDAIATQTRRRK